MALLLADQYTLVFDPDFRKRVDAAVALTVVVDMQNPSSDPTVQAQRMRLVKDVMESQTFHTDWWAWLQVTNPSNTSVDSITDTALESTVQTYFDQVAKLLYPVP